MPRKKSQIFRALKPAHLQAIGRVAAEWSRLETTLQYRLSEVANIELVKSLILTKSGHIGTWMEMLRNMVAYVYPGDKKVQDELKALKAKIEKLQIARNLIVHSAWQALPEHVGLINKAMFGSGPRDPALGLRFPKRGSLVGERFTKSAVEMRQIAKDISAATDDLDMIILSVRVRASQHKSSAPSQPHLHKRPN